MGPRSRVLSFASNINAKGKTSYIDRVGQTDCNFTVKQAELPDIGETFDS